MLLRHALRPDPDPTVPLAALAAGVMLGPGPEARLVAPLRGAPGTTTAKKAGRLLAPPVPPVPPVDLHLGLVIAVIAVIAVTVTVIVTMIATTGIVVTADPTTEITVETTTILARTRTETPPQAPATLLGINRWPPRLDMVATRVMAVTAHRVLRPSQAEPLLVFLPRRPVVRRPASPVASTRSSVSTPMPPRRRPLPRLEMLHRRLLRPWICRPHLRALRNSAAGLRELTPPTCVESARGMLLTDRICVFFFPISICKSSLSHNLTHQRGLYEATSRQLGRQGTGNGH